MDERRSMVEGMVEEAVAQGLEMRGVRHAKRQGVGIGRNTGAGVGQRELIGYIDSDCVASPGWLKELVPAFQDSQRAAVGGMIRAYDRDTLLGRYEDGCPSLFLGVRPQ